VIVATTTTLVLAVLIGLMSLASGIGGYIDPSRWRTMFDELDRSPGLVLAMAILAFGFGAVIVSIHNLWTDPLAIVVTLIGWAALVEGIALLAIPQLYLGLARRLVAFARAWAVFAILLGAFLLAAGLAGRADPLAVL
jgi:hypothetical protein